MRLRPIIFLLLGCHLNNPDITESELRHHLKRLASDSLQGRKAGTEMEFKAASYIANEYSKTKLRYFGKNYFQSFEFSTGMEIGKSNNVILFDKKLKIFTDYSPLTISDSKEANGRIMFGGYGIVAEEIQYNNYANIDVVNKIVMVLSGKPNRINQQFHYEQHIDDRRKAIVAREHGASGIIIINNNLNNSIAETNNLKKDEKYKSVGIPVIEINTEIANKILGKTGNKISTIVNLKNINSLIGLDTNVNITIQVEIIEKFKKSQNVVGCIPGSGNLKNEYIVIGAHYDHLGWGGEGSGSLDPDAHAIHNGADDNASGITAIIELMEYFTQKNLNNKRGIIFVSFGAEEEGLIGSSFFIENPPIDTENIVAMINLDMIGRMKGKNLVIGGTGTSLFWEKTINELNTDKLITTFNEEGYGDSDHQNFYLKNIPVLFFFTGVHKDYHRPSDDIKKINFDGLKKITKFVQRIVTRLITQKSKPEFKKVEKETRQSGGFSI